MDSEWLASWLSELSLTEYTATFEGAGYTSPELCATITDKEQLKSIGVTKVGHLNRLFRAVEKLGSDLRGDGMAAAATESATLPRDLSGVPDSRPPVRAVMLEQSKSASLSSLSREGGTKKPPPPVPQRKSVRRATTSPINPVQSPVTSPDTTLGVAPPPVFPRQQSLKMKAPVTKPPVAARRGVHTIARGDVSTTDSSPAPEANGPSPSPAATPPRPLGSLPQARPKPKPRLHSPAPTLKRELAGDNRSDLVEEVISNGQRPPPIATAAVVGQIVANSLPVEPEVEVTSPPPPPVPVKKASGAKRIIIPDEDVVFELEDVPMPETPREASMSPVVSAPILKEKEDAPSVSSVPPVPSKEATPSTSPMPPLPPKEATPSTSPLPPIPPKEATPSTSPMPPLPPKEATPSTSPMPPLPPKEATPSTSPIPPLPPKEATPSTSPLPPIPPKEATPSTSPIPPLPLKDKDVTPSVSPAPPLPQEVRQSAPSTTNPPSASPELDEPSDPELPSYEEATGVAHLTNEEDIPSSKELSPPLPVRRHMVTSNETVVVSTAPPPPLPHRDSGPPSFSPPPPPDLEDDEGLPPPTVCPVQEPTGVVDDRLHIQSSVCDDDDIILVGGLDGRPQPTAAVTVNDRGSTPESDEATSSLPPTLPPKEQPPPPPPITPEDFPEDFSDSDMSDSDEESGPLISIQSSRTHDDDRMMVTQTLPSANGGEQYSDDDDDDDDSSATPSSSVENTPKKKAVIRQSGSSLQRGFTNEDIMLVSPQPPPDQEGEDYMNQEAIDKANEEDRDYMNQDAIDQSLADEDDVNATNVKKENFVIRGTSPIKSRTLEKGCLKTDQDYENQDVVDDVLEGDIIPVGTMPGMGAPASLPEMPCRDYSYSTPPPIPQAQSRKKHHNYEDLDGDFNEGDSSHPRSATISFDGKRLNFGGGGKSNVTPAPVVQRSNEVSTQLEEHEVVSPRSSEDELKAEHALESSGGSMNSTFPRTMSTASTHYKPPLPKQQDSSSDLERRKRRSNSVDDITDTDGEICASVPAPYGGFNESYQLPRAAGTFAGVQSGYKRPPFTRYQSDDPLSRSNNDGRRFAESTLFYPGSTRKDSADLVHVPKTKDGFLYKKGGVHGDKPWQRRWVTFNGTELKYFKNQSDKDKSSRNIINLAEMIDVKKVPDDDKPNRFDLVVINRVFQFHAESLEESQVWINVLHAAISRFKPQEVKEGGNMSDPDRKGFLLKQGHGPFAKFKERYVALKGSKFAYYLTQEDFVHGRPIHILEMTLSSVRPDMVTKLPRFVITMNNQKQYVFQASDELERKEWIDVMTSAILTGLDTREQTLARTVKQTKSTEILKRIQENPSNKTCADCSASEPVWGVINLGIMVCINCSGVHRSMGTHISKVRSVELDHQIWKESLIKLMNAIGNERSNSFWERHSQHRERLPADVERDIRENFIRAKYQVKSWIPTSTGESQETLNKLLCVAVKTDNLMRTVELLTLGADVCHIVSDPDEPDVTCALDIAKKHNQMLQVELLEQNGALICRKPQEAQAPPISKKGFLHKTGSDRSGWKRRYCTLDKFRGFQYYKSDTDTELLGKIHMDEMLSVGKCDDELSRDAKYQQLFEVITPARGYLLCADSEGDMESWIQVFQQIINASDVAEKLGYDKIGYLKKKDPHNVGGWRRRWFTLKGKSLTYFKEREEVDVIDLRKVTDLKGPDPSGTYEQQCSLQIIIPDRTYHLKAENPAEAESWMSALRHTQVSGIPISEQQLTSTGIPILIHKCLQFIESHGMETEGLYRLSGEKSKIRKLILAFNQDARGVVIDPEMYNVHDVTGTLKLFFRSLPDPLLTHQLYSSFIATMQSDHESQLYQLQSLIEQMPLVNKDTLKRMIGHLRKVSDYEAKNKMGVANLVRLLGPTMMTVDGDPMSFSNTQFECNCVSTMIKYYKWLFQVDEEEEKKEEAIEKGLQKIKEAEQMQQRIASISSNLGFLTTIYIGSKEGDSFNTNITGQTTVAEVVEDVATRKALPKANYALYLVLGDSESHRVLSFSEKLLAAQCSAGTECFLCLKPNAFAETLGQYFNTLGEGMPVSLHVREKKKWRKYPCTVRNNHFIQFKDVKCHNEFFKVGVHDLDIFAGIERNKIDVRNPMPTRYCFWIKSMRGDENCKFLCADSESDMLKIMAAIVQAKYPDRLQTPLLPVRPPPETQTPPLGINRRPSPKQEREDSATYSNVKLSGRTR